MKWQGSAQEHSFWSDFLAAVFVLRVPPSSSTISAVPQFQLVSELCSIHTRSRGTHQRSILFPEGNSGYHSVFIGNAIAWRTALILMFASSRGIRWVLEQPENSAAVWHPALDRVFSLYEACQLSFQHSVVHTRAARYGLAVFGKDFTRGSWELQRDKDCGPMILSF